MGLRSYLAKRAVNTILLLFFVMTLNFVIFQLMPGLDGAIQLLAGNPEQIDEDTQRELLVKFGFCKGFDAEGECIKAGIFDRYFVYIANMLTFQFGYSSRTGVAVADELVSTGRMVNTLVLIGTAIVLSYVVGIFLGVYVAARRATAFDAGWVFSSLITHSLPTFFMGLIFIIIFAQWLDWFPSGGVTPSIWIISTPPLLVQYLVRLQHLFLPALTLTLFSYGGALLLTRATMLETLSEDYVLTARAKGLKERVVLFRHALKNASLPLVTGAALSFGFILSGAIITETIFNWDGVGKWLFDAINWKDGAVMQAMFFLIGLQVIVANVIADVIYGVIDPRIRYE